MRHLTLPMLGFAAALAASPAGAGGLFVAGQESQSVLEYDSLSGAFQRVVASTISVGFQNPAGIALNPATGELHVASAGSGQIWRYTTATGVVIAPALLSGLTGPRGIGFDATGANLFVADRLDSTFETTNSVKKLLLPAGPLTTVGSVTNAEFYDVAVNGTQVFASDTDGNRVVRFPVAGGAATTVINTGLSAPTSLWFRSSTRLLIADSGSDRVLEYLLSGSSWVFDRVVLPASSGVVEPCSLALAPDGRLSVGGCGSHDVVLVDLTTLAVTPLVAPGSAGLSVPKDLVWSGSTLLVASAPANAVIYYGVSGQPTGVRARGISAPLDGGIAFSPDGQRLLVASFGANDVVEHDVATGELLRTFGSVCGLLPIDLAYGPDGKVYVACLGDSGVSRIDPVAGESLGAFVLGGSGGLLYPHSLAFGPDGDLYVSSSSGEILRYDGASGDFAGVFVDSTGNGGGAIDPYGLVFHQGRLYVASYFASEVKAFDAATGAFVSTFVTSGSGGLSGPTALAFGPDGRLYVTSYDDDTVRRYDGVTGAFAGVFVPSGSGGLGGPLDLAFQSSGPGPIPVPALSPSAHAALMFALVAAAGSLARRRSEASS